MKLPCFVRDGQSLSCSGNDAIGDYTVQGSLNKDEVEFVKTYSHVGCSHQVLMDLYGIAKAEVDRDEASTADVSKKQDAAPFLEPSMAELKPCGEIMLVGIGVCLNGAGQSCRQSILARFMCIQGILLLI